MANVANTLLFPLLRSFCDDNPLLGVHWGKPEEKQINNHNSWIFVSGHVKLLFKDIHYGYTVHLRNGCGGELTLASIAVLHFLRHVMLWSTFCSVGDY